MTCVPGSCVLTILYVDMVRFFFCLFCCFYDFPLFLVCPSLCLQGCGSVVAGFTCSCMSTWLDFFFFFFFRWRKRGMGWMVRLSLLLFSIPFLCFLFVLLYACKDAALLLSILRVPGFGDRPLPLPVLALR